MCDILLQHPWETDTGLDPRMGQVNCCLFSREQNPSSRAAFSHRQGLPGVAIQANHCKIFQSSPEAPGWENPTQTSFSILSPRFLCFFLSFPHRIFLRGLPESSLTLSSHTVFLQHLAWDNHRGKAVITK